MADTIKVAMADLQVARVPDILVSYGLGSCVGIALYDPVAKIGGLAHIMLPRSSPGKPPDNPYKYANTAIPLMLREMLKMGAKQTHIVAKIAGGAQMFTFTRDSDIMRIGDRNTEAVKGLLQEFSIRLLAQDTGGNYGRTIELYTTTGILRVKTIDRGEKVL